MKPSQRLGRRRHRQTGVSLVELMVAMTIGLFLIGAIAVIYVTTASSSRSSALESQMNEDASLALDILQQQIRLAGYSTVDADGNRKFSGLALRGCDGGFVKSGVSDNAGTTAFGSLACPTTASTDSDALAVRYEANLLNSQEVGTTKLPGNCSYDSITAWTPGATEGSATSINLADNRYYIANDGTVPTLYCKGRDGSVTNGFSAAAALIPNIEDMQIQYIVTKTPVKDEPLPHQVTAYFEAKDLTDWSRVAAIRICLIARSAQPAPTGGNEIADLGTYRDCAGTSQSKTDRYLRRAYVTTIQLRNMRPGLPAAYEATAGVAADPYAYLTEAQ